MKTIITILHKKYRPVLGSLLFVWMFLLAGTFLMTSNKAHAAACSLPTTDLGTVTITKEVVDADVYRVWSRIKAPNSTNNSYSLEIDGTSCYVVGDNAAMPVSAWTWVQYQNGSVGSFVDVNLASGSHTIKLIGREPDVQVDRIILTSDTTCVPSNTRNTNTNPVQEPGDNCLVTVAPTPVPSSGHFNTLPPGASLPTEAYCASAVRAAAEIRPANANYNRTKGVGGNNYVFPGVTGNYTGTTDEIIQWAACKWGVDEDVLRAQASIESYWFQNSLGDFISSANSCTPLYPIGTYPGQAAGNCPESIGSMQVRWNYHKSAFYSTTNEIPANMTNNAVYSTAYNYDYYGAVFRSCYNGNETWLNTVERNGTYAAGDVWGCLGVWVSGRWYIPLAQEYIAKVQNNLNNRIWTTSGFINAQPTFSNLNFPTPSPVPTVVPTSTLTPTPSPVPTPIPTPVPGVVSLSYPGRSSAPAPNAIVPDVRMLSIRPILPAGYSVSNVSITNTLTNQTTTAIVDANGSFTTPNKNGNYTITVSAVSSSGSISTVSSVRIRHPDLNRDGKVSLGDIASLFTKWAQNYPEYDINDNGKVDNYDLFYLYSKWGM